MHLKYRLFPSEAVWVRGLAVSVRERRLLPEPPSSFSNAGKKLILPKVNSAFHSTLVCLALKPPRCLPSLPILLSGINHSFHLLAAVDTILTRCEMQLRNNSDLIVFFSFSL